LLEVEACLLTRLYDGETLADLREDPDVRALLRRRRLSMTGLISDLERRLYKANANLSVDGV
jgi:hypothetical protein